MIQERFLNAVLNLFALQIASLSELSKPMARKRVLAYLHDHVGLINADTYMGLLDELIELHKSGPKAVIAEQASELVIRLRGQLRNHERNAVLFRFIEITALEPEEPLPRQLLESLADALGLSRERLALILEFMHDPEAATRTDGVFALLGGGPGEAFRGRLAVLRVADAELILVSPIDGETIFLEGRLLNCKSCHLLQPAQVLRDSWGNELSHSQVKRSLAGPPDQRQLVWLSGEHLEFRFPGGKYGLHELSFQERGGTLVAIMGGSGAGKSTLLGILNGNLLPHRGRLLLNGRDVHTDPGTKRGVFGYVPQEDLLFEDLTVFENLYYAARFSMAHVPETVLMQRIEALLTNLGQIETAGLKVGSPMEKIISGGQRKRLNIALELIREPTVLFVDEPTSGLSSSDSEMVMSLLKQQASQGKLIFAVIHQPSSRIFRGFDALWVIDQGGWMIFRGSPLEAISYFRSYSTLAGAEDAICPSCGSVNPEQILEIVEARLLDTSGFLTRERRVSPELWRDFFQEYQSQREAPASLPGPLPPPPKCLHKPGGLRQTVLFFGRDLRARLANRSYVAITLIEPLLLGLVMGMVTRGAHGNDYTYHDNQNIPVFLFMSVIVALFLGLSISAEEICKDGKIQKRERFLNLSWWSYVNAKALYLGLVSCLQTLLYLGAALLLVEIPDMFLKNWAILWTCAVASCALGLNISATLHSVAHVYILIPLLLVPQMLLSGVIVDYDDLISPNAIDRQVPGYANLLPSRWGYEALLVEQYGRNSYMRDFFAVDARKRLAEYDLDYFLPELLSRIQSIPIMAHQGVGKSRIERQLNILRNEFRRLESLTGKATGLSPGDFDIRRFEKYGPELLERYVAEIRQDALARRNAAAADIRKIESRLIQTLGQEGLDAHREKYTNLAITQRVLKIQALEPIGETPEGLFHRPLPIYRVADSAWGGAHFLAGRKRIGTFEVDTYDFNLAIILLTSFLLYLALGFRLLPSLARVNTQIAMRLSVKRAGTQPAMGSASS